MDKVFQALASKPRRDILNYLQMGEMSAGEISTKFRFSKPALSGHLRILENAGLIERDKRGQFVFFKLLPVRLEETVIGWSLNLYPSSAAAQALAEVTQRLEAAEGKKGKNKKAAALVEEIARKEAEAQLSLI